MFRVEQTIHILVGASSVTETVRVNMAKKGKDKIKDATKITREGLKETKAEVISFSTLTLPYWCNGCAGVSWDPNHTAL